MTFAVIASLAVAATPVAVAVTAVDFAHADLRQPERLVGTVQDVLKGQGFRVIGESDLEPAVSASRARELLDCTGKAPACLAAALEALPSAGVEAVVQITIIHERADARSVLLRAFALPGGTPVATFFEGGLEGEGALISRCADGAAKVAREMGLWFHTTSAVTATRTDPVLRRVGWGFLAAGVAGGIFAGVSGIRRMVLIDTPVPDITYTDKEVFRADALKAAEEQRITAVAAAIAGGTAMVTAGILLVLGFRSVPVSLELVPGLGSASMSATFRF